MNAADGNLGKMTDESLKRKERLRMLREKAGKGGDNNKNAEEDQKLPR